MCGFLCVCVFCVCVPCQVAELKRSLDVKAKEMSGMGMVMVHDLLVLTNDFLSEKNKLRQNGGEGGEGGGGDEGGSLFQKMQTKEQKQRKRRVRTLSWMMKLRRLLIEVGLLP